MAKENVLKLRVLESGLMVNDLLLGGVAVFRKGVILLEKTPL